MIRNEIRVGIGGVIENAGRLLHYFKSCLKHIRITCDSQVLIKRSRLSCIANFSRWTRQSSAKTADESGKLINLWSGPRFLN